MRGLIIKKNANLFTADSGEKQYLLKPRGTLKSQGIFVGDIVEFDESQGRIDKVEDRKNYIIRPPLANIDKIFITIAPSPQPDFLLVDKMIICCFVKGIEPLLVVNKDDIADEQFIKNIRKMYEKVLKIVILSAKNAKLSNLTNEIEGVCAFAGQSAVGKSSILNAIFDSQIAEVGDLSKKIERGKQTTRVVSLHRTKHGYIADTAGFSSLDINMLVDITPQELSRYYPDFLPYIKDCKYRSCLHTQKSDCEILRRVERGDIDRTRYENYLKILDNVQQNRQKYI